MSTVFGKIIAGELESNKLYEDEQLIVIEDIAPQAPVHLLIIPKKAYRSIQQIPADELAIVTHVVKIAQKMATLHKIEDNYRFLTNNGELAGQTVWHLHFHLIGGKSLGTIG